MALNDIGKKHLGTLVLMILGILIINEVFYLINFYDPRLFLALFAFPVYTFVMYRSKVSNDLEDKVYTDLGFTKAAVGNFNIHEYQVSTKGTTYLSRAEEGNFENQKVIIAYFTVEVGSGKSKQTYVYVGVELKTVSNTLSMQLYDKTNPLTPRFGGIKLESDQFNNLFKVFVQNPQDAFYDLNPDTMIELIELRQELKQQINIEYVNDKIFVYTDLNEYLNTMNDALSITEILNGAASADDLEVFKKTIISMLEVGKKVYSLLNVKPK